MSAIAGCWTFGAEPPPRDACARMLLALRAYGPHDERQADLGAIALGRRLFRTLPEDRFDTQPLAGAGGRLTLVADVRLDNREELESALGLEQAVAARRADAALVLAAWERWGEASLERLSGEYAFALWDAREERLVLVRDPAGQRPLHYHRAGGFVAFATMPKGLHALPQVPFAPDEQAMAEFLALLPVDGSGTFFSGIESVPPASIVTVTARGLQTRRYWHPAPPGSLRLASGDYVEGLRFHLDRAVKAALRGSGGTVGAHLSGGFDSGAVTSTAARLLAPDGGRVTAFTAAPREGYDLPAPERRLADEGPLASRTAALHSNVDHRLVRASHASPYEVIDRTWALFDRPVLNPCNLVWATAICDAARQQKLTVMLTGSLGNMTISYNGAERLAELLAQGRLPTLARESVRLVRRGATTWKGAAALAFGAYVPAPLWNRLTRWRGRRIALNEYSALNPARFTEAGLAALARERGLDLAYRPRRNGFETRLWAIHRSDGSTINKGLLAGWGVDHRDPTVERRLLEFCLAAPMEQYLASGQMRRLGTRALADRLPHAVLAATEKGYQAVDWHEGLSAARGEIAAEIDRLENCPPAGRALDLARLRRLVENWPDGGWHRNEVMHPYRLALLRGISAGHFLRKVSGSNA